MVTEKWRKKIQNLEWKKFILFNMAKSVTDHETVVMNHYKLESAFQPF